MRLTKLVVVLALCVAARPAWSDEPVTSVAHQSAAPSIEQLLADMKKSPQPAAVERLGMQLAELTPKTEAEVKALLEAGRDKKFTPYAQLSLGKTADPALGPLLYENFRSMRDHFERLPPDELKKLTRSEITDAPEVFAFASVISALGNVKFKNVIPDLRSLLEAGDKYEGFITGSASEALGELGDEQTIDAVIDKALQGKPVTLSGYEVSGIRKIVQKMEQITATYKERPEQINDPRGHEVILLREQLSHSGKKTPAVREALRRLLHHPLWDVEIGASSALVWSIGPDDKDITLEMLRHKVNIVRIDGLHSLHLSRTWDKSFLPVLIDMIEHDPDPGVRDSAILELNTLPSIGVRRDDLAAAVPCLEGLLQDKGQGLQNASFEALRSLTGRFYPYNGMPIEQRRQMEMGPAYQPEPGEDANRSSKP